MKNRGFVFGASIVLLIVSLLLLGHLLRPGFFVSDDGEWMIIRLSAFYQSFREGQFPVRLLGRLNFSYGYPVANFLYPGFLYLGTLIHILGFSFITTIKIILAGSVISAGLFVFAWLLRFFRPKIAFIGALSFLLSPYLLFDIYQRGSVGEVLAIAVIAMALWAIESNRKHIVTIALAGLILSHNSVALIALPFLVIYSFVRGRLGILLSVGFAVGMTAFFWAPALGERSLVLFNQLAISEPLHYFAVTNTWFLFNLPHLFVTLGLLLFWKKQTILSRFLLIVSLIIVIITLPISTLLWQIKSFAQLFQFPFRFLSVGLFTGSWLLSAALQQIPFGRKAIAIAAIIILVPFAIWRYGGVEEIDKPDIYYSTNEATTTVANEYMPRWVIEFPTKRADQEIEFYKGKGTITINQITTQKVVAFVETEEDSILQINSIYYPGWGVLVNGSPVAIDYKNPSGLIRFPLPKGSFNIVSEFRETVARFIATLVSIVSILIWLGVLLMPQRLKHRVYDISLMLLKDNREEKQHKSRKRKHEKK